MKNLFDKLHNSKFLGKIFHTLDHCLQRELKDCATVLDLGCGPASPLRHCLNIKYSVGVEAFAPYLAEAKKKNSHSEFLDKRIEEIEYPDNSFDAVIMIEVLEHLSEEVGLQILTKAEKWARKKVLVSTPNGYFPMEAVDDNNWQRHLSGWNVEQMKKLGFTSYGMSGAKFLYLDKNAVHSLVNQADNFLANIRFKPKKLFYIINAFLQIFVYYQPRLAFGLFLVKRKNV